MPPPLGWIEPVNRTRQQEAAHTDAMNSGAFVRHTLVARSLAPGQMILLTKYWSHPDVVADVGFVLTRWHQNTGSCVKAGAFNMAISSIAAQRIAADSPIKAFMPFLWHNYALSRHYMGDDGQGEGSMGSTMARSLHEDGIRDYPVDRTDILPDYKYTIETGFEITSSEEMQWSSYRNPKVGQVASTTKANVFGKMTEATSVEDILALVQNGYACTFACNNYIGNARIMGSGADACVVGKWDTRGGHQQSILGVWNHPTLGMLYWAQNNWYADQYPKDPAGGPLCGCWVLEKDVIAAMRLDSEVFGFGLLNWFPAQPRILDWVM